jgi:hypothetical protein
MVALGSFRMEAGYQKSKEGFKELILWVEKEAES